MKNKKGIATIYIIIFVVLLLAFVGYAIYDNYKKQVGKVVSPTGTTTTTTKPTTNTNTNNVKITSTTYPNKDLTPGFLLTSDAAFLCNPGAPEQLEKNTSVDVMKQLFKSYKISYPPHKKYQIDRYIPISLGGSPDNIKNLWPQSIDFPGYEEKNQAEQYLYKLMCNRTINITVAQDRIKKDWVKVFQECCAK